MEKRKTKSFNKKYRKSDDDDDGDDIFDGLGQRPNTPVDADKDGVPDYKDKCPRTPAGATVDTIGCPRDWDADGVYDGIDRCPNTPLGIEVDNYGCPTAKPIKKVEVIHINYNRGGVEPDNQAKATLDEMAKRLKAYPDVVLEIGSYTDSWGSAKANLNISQKRAEKVKDYLVSKGIAADRLISKGYGEINFIVPDRNSKVNRRVELKPIK